MNFCYNVRLALLSIRRTWALSIIMVVCLSVGIAAWVAGHAAIYGAIRNPLPDQKGLHLVMVERPPFYTDVIQASQGSYPLELGQKTILSYSEYQAIARSKAPARRAPGAVAELVVSAPGRAPFVEWVQFTSADFFSMFEFRFAGGGPWGPGADAGAENAAVITEAMSRRLYGDADAVGRSLEVAGRKLTVAGVVRDPSGEKAHDSVWMHREHERLFLPFASMIAMGVRPEFLYGHRPAPVDEKELLGGPYLWIRLWVDLPDDAAKRAFAADLATSGVPGARYVTVAESRSALAYLHPGYYVLNLFTHVMLVATIFNLVRLLLAKFTARADQTGIFRALGASRRSIIHVHLTEAKVIGLLGGVLGVILGIISAKLLNALIPDRAADAVVDYTDAIVTLVASVLIGVIAGIYPAWRSSRVPPAVFLRRQ